ncbi:ABC transporter substrate-binding protein [Microvirga antarctica]|uniref:ABC transporter substrate-binding protein n=1 Tax=Microvirga antarctica TaxID=2819233 RepID=UPI001B30B3CF|nr:ABC transporter substrate-binding protein [Microvirga antarctica]
MRMIHARCLSAARIAISASLLSLAASQGAVAQTPPLTQGGTLNWAFILRSQSLDPNVWSGNSDVAVMRQIYDPLIWSSAPGQYEPGLATAWTISPDGLVYTFQLRKDVTFHDGTPFTAKAVKATFERIADPATKSLMTGAIGTFESAEVIDDYTVSIKLKQPWGAFLANVSGVALSPVSPAAIQKFGAQIGQNPVGTGPFMFDKWVGNDLHLKRNPTYNWAPAMMGRTGPALLDGIVVKEVPEASTRMNALRSGEVNLTHFPVLSQLGSMETAGFQVIRIDQPGFAWSFPINITKPPTDDLKVRQAILATINKDQVVRSVMFNQAKPAFGPLTAPTFGYDPAVKSTSTYDLKKAAALLDEAGWKLPAGGTIRERAGEKLKLEMIMFDSGPNKAISELTQAMLQQVGFDVTLSVTNYPAFAAKVADSQYNLAQMRWSALDPDQVIPTMFSSRQITGGGQFNRTRIADPALDKKIAEAGASTDTALRKKLYGEVQMEVMKNAWLAPIYDDVWFWLAQPSVKNIKIDLEGRPLFYVMSLAK